MKIIICRIKCTTITAIAGICRTVFIYADEMYQALQLAKAIYDCLKLLFPQLPDLIDLL